MIHAVLKDTQQKESQANIWDNQKVLENLCSLDKREISATSQTSNYWVQEFQDEASSDSLLVMTRKWNTIQLARISSEQQELTSVEVHNSISG